MEQIFFDITIIICVAAVLTILFRALKQPPILAYILTGILLGPLHVLQLQSHEALITLGQLGITLLLFLLGLELKLGELRTIGKPAVIAGTLQMLLTFVSGLLLALGLGFSLQVGLLIAIALSFSSTIIIVKLLSDKKDLSSLHGRLAVGILLMQDFFAVLTIIFLSSTRGEQNVAFAEQIGFLLLKVIALFGTILVLSRYVFPSVVHRLARSHEALFLFSLAWVFSLTALVSSEYVGFSIEIGGFLAGIALANTRENFQIVARMKSLRDFFITIFFVVLGLEMSFDNVGSVIFPALAFSLFVLFIKPVFVMTIAGFLSFHKRNLFLTGISLGQISEFSLIILFLARERGIVGDEVITLMVLVGLITFVASNYAILNENKLYELVKNYLDPFERYRVRLRTELETHDAMLPKKDHVIVIGADQMGLSIIHALENSGEEVVVVDFDPEVIKHLHELVIPAIFGDIADPEIQERATIAHAKLVISTVPDLEDNLLLMRGLRHVNKRAKVIVMALETEDARELYREGADYVVLPHLAGGRHLAKIIVDQKHLELIEDYKARDLAAIKS